MGKPTADYLEAQQAQQTQAAASVAATPVTMEQHIASAKQTGSSSSQRAHASRHTAHVTPQRGDDPAAQQASASSSVAATAAAASAPASSSSAADSDADADPIPLAADDDRSVAQLLQSLELHRAECEAAQLYVEAERVRELAQAMRERQEARHADAMHSAQQAQRMQRDQQLAEEQAAFQRERADRLRAFDESTADRERSMRLSHVTDLEAWESKHVTALLLIRPKYGRDVLAMQAQQAALARARNYVAAEKIRAQLEAQCERELLQLRARCEHKAVAERERFHAAQEKAVQALRNKRALERVQLAARLDSQLHSQVLQRHVNHESEMLRAQSKQIGRWTKLASLDCSVSQTVRQMAPRRNHALLPSVPSATAEPSGSVSARGAEERVPRITSSPLTSRSSNSRGGQMLSTALQRRLAAEEWERQHSPRQPPSQSQPAPSLPVVEEKSASSTHAITVPSIASLAAAPKPSPAMQLQARHREQLQRQQEALDARNAPPPPSVPSPAAARTARQHHLAQLKARPDAKALAR